MAEVQKDALPWARWWEPKCPERSPDAWDKGAHCDLRRGHDGPHVAERGMDDIVWEKG